MSRALPLAHQTGWSSISQHYHQNKKQNKTNKNKCCVTLVTFIVSRKIPYRLKISAALWLRRRADQKTTLEVWQSIKKRKQNKTKKLNIFLRVTSVIILQRQLGYPQSPFRQSVSPACDINSMHATWHVGDYAKQCCCHVTVLKNGSWPPHCGK